MLSILNWENYKESAILLKGILRAYGVHYYLETINSFSFKGIWLEDVTTMYVKCKYHN